MIEVRGLTKAFGSFYALRGITLSIPQGSCLCIFGPNGAGKTTFIRILSTLSRPDSGQVKVAGIDIREAPQVIRRRLGVISHTTYLYDELTADENLRFYAKLYDVSNVSSRIKQALREVGLFERRHDRVRTYSRGMQQRLSIARAMLHDPDILYLDEPYTGLDQHAAKMLTEWLSRLRSERRTILLVTHDIEHGLAISDRVAILLRGKVVFDEATAALSKDDFQKRYFKIIATGGKR